MKQRIFTWGLTFVLLLIPLTAFAGLNNIPYGFGFGARGIGIGSAYTALTDDASCAFFNPAAMAMMENSQIMLSYLYGKPDFEGGPKGDTFTFDEANEVIQTNLVIKLNSLLKSKWPVALGLNISLDDNMNAFIRFNDLQYAEGHYSRYGVTSFTLNGALGFKVFNWLYLGGGVLTTLHTKNDMFLRTDMSGNTNSEGMAVTVNLRGAPVAALMVHFDPIDLGLTYHGATHGQFDPIVVGAAAQVGESPLADLPMTLMFKDSIHPARAAFGFAWRALDWFTLHSDIVWYNYEQVQDQMGEHDLARAGLDIDLVNIWVPHVGLEFEPFEYFFLRTGYGYEPNPFDKPGSNGNVILDNDKHMASAGVGYDWQDPVLLAFPVRFDAAYFMHYLIENEFETSDGLEYESSGIMHGGVFSMTLRF